MSFGEKIFEENFFWRKRHLRKNFLEEQNIFMSLGLDFAIVHSIMRCLMEQKRFQVLLVKNFGES